MLVPEAQAMGAQEGKQGGPAVASEGRLSGARDISRWLRLLREQGVRRRAPGARV